MKNGRAAFWFDLRVALCWTMAFDQVLARLRPSGRSVLRLDRAPVALTAQRLTSGSRCVWFWFRGMEVLVMFMVFVLFGSGSWV